MLKAIRDLWPYARVYASTSHLALRVRELLSKYKLRGTPLQKYVRRGAFSGSGEGAYGSYIEFWVALQKLLEGDLSEFSDKQKEGLEKLQRWVGKHQSKIVQSLVEWHWPVSIGALERALRTVKDALFDRRYNLKNMERLQHLLYLIHLCINRDPARPVS